MNTFLFLEHVVLTMQDVINIYEPTTTTITLGIQISVMSDKRFFCDL